MKFKIAVGAALLGLLVGTGTAFAVGSPDKGPGSKPQKETETEFGRTLPPIGYVQFCARLPDDNDCKPASARKAEALTMSPERWNLLYQVNTYVNGKIAPVSDQDLYGQPEYWAYPTDAGDCEDYVLLKRRFLESLGFPAAAMLVTVVLDENKQGHAVLTVTTKDGDYILDNRRNDVRRWSDTGYTYLKRQSASDPRIWVSLSKDAPQSSGFVAGGTGK
ncbi:MAG: transglutaminase-like cysteine peptidase [Rhizobiales bacterium]|nr:transglutaminase-like cysteine peptidase [Hyphomicrobiales bacterium]MBI3672605.1 transglutaminase-like cysteine peptidase [Hyphomicrobiales bacterium]